MSNLAMLLMLFAGYLIVLTIPNFGEGLDCAHPYSIRMANNDDSDVLTHLPRHLPMVAASSRRATT